VEEKLMRVKLNIVHEGQTYFGEVELHPAGTEKATSKPHRTGTQTTSDIATRPSAAVDLVYRKGFFKESRRLSEVFDELRSEGYNFSRQSIFMALKAARFLALTGPRGSYRFVQKFPPMD
jgi:hypothetical protein